MKRNYKIDNIKLILIFLVVFGHLLECFSGNTTTANLYKIIYSFHIPAFIFVLGFFAKFNIKKILKYIFIYVIFQIFYCLFANAEIQFYRPYWLLWYLFVIPFYYLLIPIYNHKNTLLKFLLILLTIVISLITGSINSIGYNFSLSRFFTFLPFFVVGFYVGHSDIKLPSSKIILSITCKILSLIAVCFSIYFITHENINSAMLYGSYSYSSAGYNFIIKFKLLLVALCWIFFFMSWVPNINIKFITVLGKGTFSVYLLHGFFICFIKSHPFLDFSVTVNLLLCLTFDILIILIFGNKYFSKFFNDLFFLNYVEKLCDKTKKHFLHS